mmetsp:Transcript_30779/g.46683  ORF Transcript_30779/g.46683 Transcript_30779/m.46683 type:complete len:297 (+) Transcript_30779:49-939(+)|eukprot:CAMPEP_0178922282 /NCGR_PEP_ID=MMETSP0786-20121207/16064_1 /TAXON_ID=186022 /ORGANISM="Thalassionema frauenfeldii, Strain CCMP 1798" /LENGTH=296 /DNA_ID=CAMNT_0020596623 /DNA_START=26 /DNA_END=916 /DNA_ORIENTATION=+
MPRGHFKNKSFVSEKIRRGGGSKKDKNTNLARQSSRSKTRQCFTFTQDDICDYSYGNDDSLLYDNDDMLYDKTFKSESRVDIPMKPIYTSECTLCFEQKPLMKLMKSCQHQSACHDCLYRFYIQIAQQDISMYPLKCWHPACSSRLLQNEQIQKLVKSKEELTKHYRLSVLASARRKSKLTADCPSCEHPVAFPPRRQKSDMFLYVRAFTCLECSKPFKVEDSSYQSTILALDRMSRHNCHDGWAQCPRCRMVISKNGGCSHMTCICGQHFDWREVEEKLRTKRSFAKMLTSQDYL